MTVRRYLLPCALMLLVLTYFSCRKVDQQGKHEYLKWDIEKFFKPPQNPSPSLRAVFNRIKWEDSKYHFVRKVIKNAGYPQWDDVLFVGKKRSENIRMSSEEDFEMLFIPFVPDDRDYVKGMLAVKITDTDTSFRMIYHWQYKEFAFSENVDSEVTARNIFQLFITLEQNVFGRRSFEILDSRLLTDIERNALNQRGLSFSNTAVQYSFTDSTYECNECLLAQRKKCKTYGMCFVALGDPWCDRCESSCDVDAITEPICYNFVVVSGIFSGGGSGGYEEGGGPIWPEYHCYETYCDENAGWGPAGGSIPPGNIDGPKLNEIYNGLVHKIDNLAKRGKESGNREWGFIIGKSAGDVLNWYNETEGPAGGGSVRPKTNLPSNISLVGVWHYHPDDGYAKDGSFSPGDFYWLYYTSNKANSFSIITTELYAYAMVIEDPVKLKDWFKPVLPGQTIEQRIIDLYSSAPACTGACPWNKVTDLGVKAIMGDPAISGIRVYKTLRTNINFQQLN